MSELDALDAWIKDTIESFDPPERRRLLRKIGPDLRRNTQRRMRSQIGVDGQKWAARKDGSRRQMFKRLRLARNLKTTHSADAVKIGWTKKTGGIARVHHYGLRDRVSRRGVRVKYEARQLLGLSKGDRDDIDKMLTEWLSAD